LLSEFTDFAVGTAEVYYPYAGPEFDRLAEKLDASFSEFLDVGVNIIHFKSDMDQAPIALPNIFRYVLSDRIAVLKKFKFGPTQFEVDDTAFSIGDPYNSADTVVGDIEVQYDLHSEIVPVKFQRVFDVADA